jgi:eukaryotic-like serine/threonine-protein kinase
MHLGIVLGRLGRTSEALALEAEAEDLARRQGNRGLEADVAIATADVLLVTGASDLAIEHAQRALIAADTPSLRAAASAFLARARAAAGESASALDAAREAIAIIESGGGAHEVEPLVRLAYAEGLDAAGQKESARDALARAVEVIELRASAIADEPSRRAFLARVPVNARILQMHAEWSKRGP